MRRLTWVVPMVMMIAGPVWAYPVLLTDFGGHSDVNWQEADYGGSANFVYNGQEMYQGTVGTYNRGGVFQGGGQDWFPAADEALQFKFWNITDADGTGTSSTISLAKVAVELFVYNPVTTQSGEGYFVWDIPDINNIPVGGYAQVTLPLAEIDGAVFGSKTFHMGPDRIYLARIRVSDSSIGMVNGPNLVDGDYLGIDDLAIVRVPEPVSAALLALGGLAAIRRRR